MELAEMKDLWTEMSRKVEQQDILTDQLIMKMTQERYHNKLRGIATYEQIGSVFCWGIAIVLMIFFNRLDTPFLKLCGLLSIGFYLLVPVITLASVYQLQQIRPAENNYRQSLVEFARAKRRFLFLQQTHIVISFLILIVFLPVATKLLNGKELSLDSEVWAYYLPLGGIALFLFARWGYRCYERITEDAGRILEELDS